MIIREPQESDLTSLVDIYNQAINEQKIAITEPVTLDDRGIWFAGHDADKYPVLIAEDQGEVLGFLSINSYRPGRAALRHTAVVSYFVDKKHQHQGVASALLEKAISLCPKLEIKNLFAILLENNIASVHLLKKFGFEKWAHLPGVAEFEGIEVDQVYYGRRIAEAKKGFIMKKLIALLMSIFMCGCVKVPPGVTPVSEFNLNRYLGVWYEVARLDHRFERGLNNVTAEYSMRPGGGVTVKNRGFMVKRNEWRNAEGKAFFVNESNVGHLKVSFFPPFYGSYVVFELDPDYQYAFVCGDDTSYLWLLSRTPQPEQEILDDFEDKARSMGFDTSKLIYVHHSPQQDNG